jgi:hypothetical protein
MVYDDVPRSARKAAIHALEKISHADKQIFYKDYGDESEKISPEKIPDLLTNIRIAGKSLHQMGEYNQNRSSFDGMSKAIQEDDAHRVRYYAGLVLNSIRLEGFEQHIIAEKEELALTFELEISEVDQVRELTAEMREIVNATSELNDEHRPRVLKRINSIDLELLKPQGSFDVILAGIVDFGEALGDAGRAAKPAIDRMKEIRKIIEPKVKNSNQLAAPETPKSLPGPEGSGADDEG